MTKVLELLQGKKTYISAISGVLVASAALAELVAPQVAVWLLSINGFLTAAFLRAGVASANEG